MGLTCKGEARADQETSANEHGDRLGNSLNGGHNTHDRCAQPDGLTTTKAISNIGQKGYPASPPILYAYMVSASLLERVLVSHLDGIKQTKLPTRW